MPAAPIDLPADVATGGLVWVRAWLLSGVALGAGAFAHLQADGLLPGPGVLVTLVAVGALVCAPFLRRPGSTLRITALLVLGQSAVHVVLAGTAGHRGDPVVARTPRPALAPPTGSSARRGSYFDVAYSAPRHGDVPAGTGIDLSVPAPLVHAVGDVAAHPAMAVAHLLAAVVCGLWLARGERALWTLLALAGRGWQELLAPLLRAWAVVSGALTLHPGGPVVAVRTRVPRPLLPVRGRSTPRRGPPYALVRPA